MDTCATASDDSRVDESGPVLALDDEVHAAAGRQLALLTSLPPHNERDLVRFVTEPLRLLISSITVLAGQAAAEAARRRRPGVAVTIEQAESLAPGVPLSTVTEWRTIPPLRDCFPRLILMGALEECFRLSIWLGKHPIARLQAGRKLLPVLLGEADDLAIAAASVIDSGEPSLHADDPRPRGALANFIENLGIEDGVHDQT